MEYSTHISDEEKDVETFVNDAISSSCDINYENDVINKLNNYIKDALGIRL